MSFIDKVKGAAGNAVSVMNEAASAVGEKSKEISERSKLTRAIKTEEAKITGMYTEMGQKLFNESETAPSGYESQFQGINTSLAEIEKLKKALEMLDAGKTDSAQ